MKSVYKQAVVALAVLVALNAQAAAPVSDLSGDSGGGVVLSGNNGAIVPTGSLEDRVALLERTLNARLRLQAELQQQVDSLQGEVSELRGQLEQQTYQMEQSQERQRQLYQELDKVANNQPAATPAAPAVAAASATSAAAANYSTNLNENQAYDAAVNMVLKEKNYDKAIPAFEGFIKQYPSSSYVPNAHYWLGQLLFNKGDRTGAAAQFTTVATKFSKSPKRADALLKLGMLAQLDGKKAEAKNFYEQVIKGYPNTSPAQLAKQSLSKL
ncbi:tol-pal system protein YbgF [Aeromonas hydrophila]|uniref:tol-pal system protein YbgF n=1 Tax=Aeromonas hydrophila TaxID=644 RepID=UPI00191541F8|nr:tol-pal system protein YbgF [Aeromonas hydrophila]MCF7677445.1 tol-pal system protein YbgF [Aeromonas hydrophila]MCF7679883.1 tol-pal system protein YbgF [Aeromonas hydrophila]MCF7690248.1 tol-pal system protein YbgF [Aeromonas hydrophila]MCF7692874.1 tol-pal system protein YbgF [Aeromonas hydrophila]MCF7775121.1 tol-pal system protein YbgF [Aeromonas hydrophila]